MEFLFKISRQNLLRFVTWVVLALLKNEPLANRLEIHRVTALFYAAAVIEGRLFAQWCNLFLCAVASPCQQRLHDKHLIKASSVVWP